MSKNTGKYTGKYRLRVRWGHLLGIFALLNCWSMLSTALGLVRASPRGGSPVIGIASPAVISLEKSDRTE